MSDRDWREWAYLEADNWPEAIPPMGPKREYGPYPWTPVDHDHLTDVDNYPFSHPDACSISDRHTGDVCPWCGVPLTMRETVIRARDGAKGELLDLSPHENPVPTFHSECWKERERERVAQDDEQTTLAEVV